eukprot:scaffold66917_cov45-Prasinocladus_malaysianus.AAC.3
MRLQGTLAAAEVAIAGGDAMTPVRKEAAYDSSATTSTSMMNCYCIRWSLRNARYTYEYGSY